MQRARLLLPVYLPTFLLAFSQGILIPTLPLYAQQFTPSFGLVSLVVSAAGLGTLLTDVPAGLLLERLGRRRMMLLGTGALALANLGLALAHLYPELVVYRLIAGAGTACWNLSRLAYLTDVVPPAQRGRALSTFGGVNRIGTFTGPAIGGAVGYALGLPAAILLTAALSTGALVLAFVAVPESGLQTRLHHRLRWRVLGDLFRHHWPELLAAGTAQLWAQMIRAGRQIIVPLYGASVLGLDVAAIGSIVSLSAAIDMSLFLPAGVIMDRLGRKFASVPSFAVLSLGMLLVPLAHDYWGLLLATAVMGLGNGLGSGTMMTLGADLAPKEATGEFLGLWRLLGDAGSAGGPLVVGMIADLVGLTLSALALAGIGALAAVTLLAFVRETRAEAPAGSPTRAPAREP